MIKTPVSQNLNNALLILNSLIVVFGLIALVTGIFYCRYDYDEIERSHSIWMVSQGLRPYHDFFENHPPFYWYLIAPVASLFGESVHILTFYRIFSAIGTLLFLGAIWGNAVITCPSYKYFASFGLALVAFAPAMLVFFVEFRFDGWNYALLLWSIYWFRKSEPKPMRYWQFGFASAICVFLSPKLVLLPPLIASGEIVFFWQNLRSLLMKIFHYSLGIIVAMILLVLFFLATNLDIQLFFTSVIRYHYFSKLKTNFHYGLLKNIIANAWLAILIGSGVLTWLVVHVRRKAYPNYFEIALFVMLLVQTLLIAFPYKQYYVPWFYLAAYFLCYVVHFFARISLRYGLVLIILILLIFQYHSAMQIYHWQRIKLTKRYKTFIITMNIIARPFDRVVTVPPLHPIFRRNVFFGWSNSYDPAGHETEYLIRNFLPPLQDKFSKRQYIKELKQNPPAFVLLGRSPVVDKYYPQQNPILQEFIQRNQYLIRKIDGYYFAIRQDRFFF